MSLSPAPFLRIGFAILGLGIGLGVWTDQGATLGAWAMPAAVLAFLGMTAVGELVLRRAVAAAEAQVEKVELRQRRD